MARGPNEKSIEAERLYQEGMRLVDIADKLEVPAGTVRRWKSTYRWDRKIDGKEGKGSERSGKQEVNVRKHPGQKQEAVAGEVREVVKNTDLTDKQQLFCIYYVRCFNATKAYQKAYNTDYATAMTGGSRLLGKDKVKQEIMRLKQDRLNREFFSEDDIFQKYMNIAYADITDFTEFGSKEIEVTNSEAGESKKVTVSYVNLKDSKEIDGTLVSEVSKGKDGVKVKLADRMKALQWLSDHMDLATEKQRAEIALLKSRVETDGREEEIEDGFIDALNVSAKEDWYDEKGD